MNVTGSNNFKNTNSPDINNSNYKSCATINLPKYQKYVSQSSLNNNQRSQASINNMAINTLNSIQDPSLKKCFSDIISEDLDNHVIDPKFSSILSFYNNASKPQSCKCKDHVSREDLVFTPI